MYSNTLVFAAAAITSLGAVALFSAPASAQYYGGGYCAYHMTRSAWQVSWRPTCIITTTNTMTIIMMTIIMIITPMITIIMTMTMTMIMTTIITTKTGGPSLIS